MSELSVISKSTFLGKEIDVYGTADEPLFLATDVAEWIEHSNVTEMLRGVDEDEKLTSTILRAGQRRNCNFLTENGLYEVLMLSTKSIAKQFKKGVKEILKSIRKTGAFTASSVNSYEDKVRGGLAWCEGLKKILNLSDAATLTLSAKIAEPLGLPIPDDIRSDGALLSAKALLKQHNAGISSQAFNKLAEANGFIETLYRTDSKGEQKAFRNITTKGSKFGENRLDKHNLNETQPKWYVSTFGELLKLLGVL